MNFLKLRNIINCARVSNPGIFKSLRFSSSLTELLEKERDLLCKFKGGSVDLCKDESSGIAVVTLNKSDTKNSLTGTMMLELEQKVIELENWDNGRGVILNGKNNSFCSGIDLSLIKEMQRSESKEHPYLLSSFMQRLLTRLYVMPLVSVALVEGAALGGGAELTTSCDMRVMSQNASIGFVQTKMGLSFAFGSSFRLVNILGRQEALKVLTSARVMGAEEARGRGLVDEMLQTHKDPLEETKEYLTRFSTGAPEVIAAAKQSISNNINMHHLEVVNTRERNIFASLFGGPANLDALKKKPKF